MSAPRVLVVQHEAICPPGWVGDWLIEAGCDLHICRPYAGDSLPEDLAAYEGLLVLGGIMGANDDATIPWLSATKALVRLAADTGTAALGICLGHQLTAVALGGVVGPDPLGSTVGVHAVGWCDGASADPLMGGIAADWTVAVQWNNDTVVELPPGAVTLARGHNGRVQAARFAPSVWGVQCHPEAGSDVVRAWAELDRPTAAERGLDIDAALDEVEAQAPLLISTWRPLAQRFAALCAGRLSVQPPPAGAPAGRR